MRQRTGNRAKRYDNMGHQMGIGDIRFGRFRHSLFRATLASAIAAGLPISSALAQSASTTEALSSFDIPAGDLAVALDRFSIQTGLQVAYSPELVAGKRIAALAGRMTWRDALGKLLRDSGLEYQQVNGTTLVIRRVAKRASGPAARPSTTAVQATASEEPQVTELAEVSVTGTRIKGGTVPSPVITITSERIREEGFTDLGEVIRSIPQNFSGGQNPGVSASANTTGNNYNTTGGSSINLRGLGQDATLTLLNGRRLSYGGAMQGVDIGAIPVEAVERLEIVADGASAIYGSDAVGGVANVVLKPDFEGVALGARVGGATDGGLATREYTATAGTTWASGGLIATFKKAHNDPITADQRDYTRPMYQPATLWQGGDLRSGLLSLHQWLGNAVELHLDALRSERGMLMDTGYAAAYYHNTNESDTTLVSPSLDLQLPGDWMLSLGAALGRDKTRTYQQVISTQTGAVSSSSIGIYSNRSATYELGVEGPLLTLPAGEARLAAGAGYRDIRFLSLGISSNRIIADGDEGSRFAYAELNVPLIGLEQGLRGAQRLDLTAAIRTEDYSTYGSVTTPKLGLIHTPSANFTLKASWGKSFKAPTLLQHYMGQDIALYPAATLGGAGEAPGATVLYRVGGNDGLRPERARTWSASLVFHPEAIPGLEAELSWFDIDYTGRIVQPVVATEALRNQLYAGFVERSPSVEAMEQAIAQSGRFGNYSGGIYDAGKVVAIVDNRSVNAARQRVKGVDLSGAYGFDVRNGRLTLRGAASWLDSAQATLPTQSPYDLSGTLFYPARVSGRAGTVWLQGGFMASVFGSYKGGIRNTTDGKKGASSTTFDATLRYALGRGVGVFSGMAFELAGQNVFNRAPPLYTVTAWNETPYDSTNYSAVGRYVSLSVSKHW